MAQRFRFGLGVGLLGALAGCSGLQLPFLGGEGDAGVPPPMDPTPITAPPPPPDARTAEAFDTTTPAERRAATAAPVAADRALGPTVASLGDPADPGFWALTPLVTQVQSGRLVDPASGKSVAVELRPRAAAPGAGSLVSLAALRALDLPLTALSPLQVSATAP
ncbi:MAG: D-galactarate dehydratase [Rhodobacteraceae bacterium]|nr:D-galactarate dehydratase [Paracoccaceae bacterium]